MHQTDECGAVLEEHRRHRGIGGVPQLAVEAAIRVRGVRAQLPPCLQPRDGLEHERHRQHDVGQPVVAALVPGPAQLVDALQHGEDAAADEDADRREQRPEVALPAVAELVALVGGPVAPLHRDQQQPSLVVSASECADSEIIAAEPDRAPGDALGDRDAEICRDGDENGRGALVSAMHASLPYRRQ